MNIPPDLLVWICGALFTQFSLCAHLLISINNRVSGIQTEQALQAQEIKFINKKEYT